jgi:DNA-binding transcriptional MerR regulator
VRNLTITEASEHYNIPIEILRAYESWGLCGEVEKVMGDWQYDDQDLERLSLIMTLHDVGFAPADIEAFMRLAMQGKGTEAARMRMLNQHRSEALDEIHFREKQLERMDYLRYEIHAHEKGNGRER